MDNDIQDSSADTKELLLKETNLEKDLTKIENLSKRLNGMVQ
jgi:hypothetical protein